MGLGWYEPQYSKRHKKQYTEYVAKTQSHIFACIRQPWSRMQLYKSAGKLSAAR